MSKRALRRRRANRRRLRRTASVEWPTLFVAVAIYGGWLALAYFHAALPWPVLILIGGALIAWHGSLHHDRPWHLQSATSLDGVPFSLDGRRHK